MGLEIGMYAEKVVKVEAQHIASHLGSGGVPVYATPAMVLHMEETSRLAVEPSLNPGQATVGASISVRHLSPTPIGMKVRIRAELTKIDGKLLSFRVEAWDEVEKIGEADHLRAVVDMNRFGEKIARKRQSANLEDKR
jgi:predicted thioesterase